MDPAPATALSEERVFLVGESVELRVGGRHGWHPATVVKAEIAPTETSFM